MIFEGRTRINTELNIAPLIDVVFLLLLFFMLTSSISRESSIALNLPSSATATQSTKTQIEIIIRSDGEIIVNDESANPQNITDVVKKIAATANESQVTLRSEAGVTVQALVSVMDSVRKAGINNISLSANKSVENGGAIQ